MANHQQKSQSIKRKSTKGSTELNDANQHSDEKGNLNGGLQEIEYLFHSKKKTKVIEKESKQKPRQADGKRVKKDSTPLSSQYWTDDGLGGKFNAEGYTGRTQDGCKIFKAHVLNKRRSGNTKDCPFDCDCCFI